MYFFDAEKISGIAVLPLMVGHGVLVIGAWYGSSVLIRKGLQGALLYVGGALALTLLILIVACIHRLDTATDFIGYQDGKHGVPLFSVRLGWAFVVSLLAMFGSAIYVAIELGRDSRRVQTR
jgi:hypothetical protein